MLVPSRAGWNPREPSGWWRVTRALEARLTRWPNPGATHGLATLLRAHGFAVDTDQRLVFRREIADAELLVDGLYLPGVEPDRVAAAKHALTAWARSGRRLAVPLRRVIAHR